MEQIYSYLQNNYEDIEANAVLLGRTAIGAVLVALTFACFYFIYFIYGVLKLEKGSREYYQLRQHIMVESLIRYAITIVCIFTIDILIVTFLQWGALSMLMGFALCLLIFVVMKIIAAMKTSKVKNV